MQYANDPTAMPTRAPSHAPRPCADAAGSGSSCAVFEAAREAACADPVLGRLWLDLFDDADI